MESLPRLDAMMLTACVILAFLLTVFPSTESHGRLVDPPSRSTMWRYGFKESPPNYNDMELFCGGFSRQWGRNGGKCGICGDPYDGARPNEAGGKYATGVVVRTYAQGSQFTATVQLTANHKGYFEFKICPAPSDPDVEVTQECLDRYILSLADGSGSQYHVTRPGSGMFNAALLLPSHLTCERCVFQWTYVAGNNWGTCPDGTAKVGCGQQEQFRGCADVTILDNGNSVTENSHGVHEEASENDLPVTWTSPPSFTTESPATTTFRRRPFRPRLSTRRPLLSATMASPSIGGWTDQPPKVTVWQPEVNSVDHSPPLQCFAIGLWATVPGMTQWCIDNCFHNPPYCPESHCRCTG